MADVVTIGNIDALADAIAAKLGTGRGTVFRGGASAPAARGAPGAATTLGGGAAGAAGDGGASTAADATTAWGQAADAAGGYGNVLTSIGPLAGAAGSALNQSLKNALETGAQITKSLADLPEVTAGFFDYYSVYIDATDDLARAFGDMGGAAGEGSQEFNALNTLMYNVAENFDSTTFAGRRLQDMGFDNMEMFKSFNQVFSETQMLSRLPMWENLSRGSPEARAEAQKSLTDMTLRMGIFQKQMGLTEDQAQTFYDLSITRSGEAAENFIVDTSIISKAFGEQGFNMKKVGQEMANLMSDYDMFGHLAPMAAAKAAAAAEKMAIPAEALAKSAEGLQSYEGAAAAISKLSMYAGVPIDLQADELMRLAVDDPAEAVMSVMDSLQRAGVDVNELNILQQREMAKAMGMNTDTFLRAANASAEGGIEAVRNAVEGAQGELNAAGEAAAGSQREMAERAAQDAASVIERGAPRAAMDLKPQEEAMNVLRRQTSRQSTEIAQEYIKVTQDANSTVRSMVSNAVEANQETIREGARETKAAIQDVRGTTAVAAAGGIARGQAPEAGEGAGRMAAFMEELRASQEFDRDLFASDEDVAALATNYLALRRTIQNSVAPNPELQQAAADMRSLAESIGINVSGATVQEALQENFSDINLDDTMEGIGSNAMSGMMDAMISDMDDPESQERFRSAFTEYIQNSLEIRSASEATKRAIEDGQLSGDDQVAAMFPSVEDMSKAVAPVTKAAAERTTADINRLVQDVTRQSAVSSAEETAMITAEKVRELQNIAGFDAESAVALTAATEQQLNTKKEAAEAAKEELAKAEAAMSELGDISEGTGGFTDAQIMAQQVLADAQSASTAANADLAAANLAAAAAKPSPTETASPATPVREAAEERTRAVAEAETRARETARAPSPDAGGSAAPIVVQGQANLVVNLDGQQIAATTGPIILAQGDVPTREEVSAASGVDTA